MDSTIPQPSILEKRISAPGPKKILSLDGGGIRGVVTLEILMRIEEILRQQLGRGDDFVLADFFDFIAGTSTGAIIAAGISSGMHVKEIRSFYLENGHAMFTHAGLLERWHFKYRSDALEALLQKVFGRDTLLGSANLRTLLMMVMRNVSTDQPWAVSNNPHCRFNSTERPDSQLHLPLWRLLRASTAAPTYFPPETLQIGEHKFIFEDGSISSYTNPAFYAFLRATAPPFDLNWATGSDNLLLISVGTGLAPHQYASLKTEDMNLGFDARAIPLSMLLSSVIEQDMLCRIFGNCLYGHALDKEIGALLGALSPGGQHLFSYARYNETFTDEGFARLGIKGIDPMAVAPIDALDRIDELVLIGQRIAENQVKAEHFIQFIPQPKKGAS